MAYLSSYLSGSGSASTQPRMRSTYSAPKKYQPYSVARRGVQGIEQSPSPYSGQDLASALLMQRQVGNASVPSTQFSSSYNYDPILAKIQALSSQSVNNAKTNAAELRKQALIASGATGIGSTLGFDLPTLTAAGQNPESDYAMLQRDYEQRLKDAADQASINNTLYSGSYVDLLNRLAAGQASAQGAIGENLRSLLGNIDQGVLDAEDAARLADLQAQTDLITQANLAGHPIYDPKTGQYIWPQGYTPTGNPTGGPPTSGGPAAGQPAIDTAIGTDGKYYIQTNDGIWWTQDASGTWVQQSPPNPNATPPAPPPPPAAGPPNRSVAQPGSVGHYLGGGGRSFIS